MKINNTDIQTTYQTHLLDTNYKDLLCYPPLKKLPSNDWAEYYGKEYDTTTPVLDTQQYTLTFISKATHYAPFITFLTAQTYNDFHFEELGKTFRFRSKSQNRTRLHHYRYYPCQRHPPTRLHLHRPQCHPAPFRLHYRRYRPIQIWYIHS